jgi:hypothetical protein
VQIPNFSRRFLKNSTPRRGSVYHESHRPRVAVVFQEAGKSELRIFISERASKEEEVLNRKKKVKKNVF